MIQTLNVALKIHHMYAFNFKMCKIVFWESVPPIPIGSEVDPYTVSQNPLGNTVTICNSVLLILASPIIHQKMCQSLIRLLSNNTNISCCCSTLNAFQLANHGKAIIVEQSQETIICQRD